MDIAINEEDVEVQMKLGDSGEAFFVEPIPENERTEVKYREKEVGAVPTFTFLTL